MKKTIILLILFAGLIFMACKKDRKCTCTITPVSQTANGVTQPVSGSSTTVLEMTKVTKKGAACNSGERTTTTTQTDSTMLVTVITVSKADCKLE